MYPKIRIQAVLKEELLSHFDAFKNIWEPLADEIGGIDFREEETAAKLFAENYSFKCNFLWQRLVVLWDGSVYPCLFHGVKNPTDIILGNIKDATIKELWHSPKMSWLRQLHSNGQSHACKSCVDCSYRKSEIIKNINSKGR